MAFPLKPQCVDGWEDFSTGDFSNTKVAWLGALTNGVVETNPVVYDYGKRAHNRHCLLCANDYPSAQSATLGLPDNQGGIIPSKDWQIGFAFNYDTFGFGGLPGARLYTARKLYDLISYGDDFFSLIINDDSTLSIITHLGDILHEPSPPIQRGTWYWIEMAWSYQGYLDIITGQYYVSINMAAGYSFMSQRIFSSFKTTGRVWVFPNAFDPNRETSNGHQFSGGRNRVRFSDILLTKGSASTVPLYTPFFGDSKLGGGGDCKA